MNNELSPWDDSLDQPVGVGISTGEQDLKKQHERRPDRWRPTEPRQEEFADHRLDLKEKEG
jgi:hypothetical protein